MSVNTKMTAIADKIRTLSGTTAAMGLDAMASNIKNANTTIETQTDLMTQIKTALQGKGVSGGGSETIETATIDMKIKEVIGSGVYISHIAYTTLENGKVTGRAVETSQVCERKATGRAIETGGVFTLEGTIECVIGTVILLIDDNYLNPDISTTGMDACSYTSYVYYCIVTGDGSITAT